MLEIEKLYTNDTHQVANTYGIEAAGRVIAAVSLLTRLTFKTTCEEFTWSTSPPNSV